MTSSKNNELGTVYSTATGRTCPDCGKAIAQCNCSSENNLPQGDGIVRISRETKGRKGKGVTLITGLPLAGVELKKIAKQLKQKCSTGGTLKDGIIEIQGDHRDLLVQELSKQGYTVKRSVG